MNRFLRYTLATPLLLLAAQAQAATYEDGVRFKNQQQLANATAAFSDVLSREPDNVLAREQLAIVLGWQSRFDESVAAWQQAIALAPQKADYRIGMGRVLYWKGEHSAALQSLNQALQLQPSNAEALKLKGDVQLAAGDAASARQSYVQAQALQPDDAEIKARIARAVPPKLWRLDAGLTYDDYSSARGQENSYFTQLGRRIGKGGDVLYARFDGYNNFNSLDQGITLGSYWLPHPKLLLNLEAGVTLGKANFRPDTQLLASGEWLLDFPVQPLLGFRYFDYSNGKVTTITPGVRVLLPGATAEARYGITDNIDGSSTGVFSARLNLPREGFSPYLAFTKGKEALPPQAAARITVLGGGVVFDLSPSWGVRADYSYEDRKGFYKHHAIGGGVTYKF